MFPVVNLLKCVVTEVVLFPVVAFETLDISRVATRLKVYPHIKRVLGVGLSVRCYVTQV